MKKPAGRFSAASSCPEKRFLLVVAAAVCLAGALRADDIPVASYSFPAAQPSSNYNDPNFTKLTDGVIPATAWMDDIAFTDGALFDGWDNTDITVRFTFAAPTLIRSAIFYFADSDGAAGIYLPETVTLSTDGAELNSSYSVTNPNGSGTTVAVTVTGLNVTTDNLTLFVPRIPEHQWMMLSEVKFSSDLITPPPIPRPAHPPTVTVKGPKVFRTTSDRVTLRGTATDPDGDVASVHVKVGKSASKLATGIASWKFVVKLKPGRNAVMVQAADRSHRLSPTQRVVVKRLAP